MNDGGAIPRAPGGASLIGHVLPLLRSTLPLLESLPRAGDLVRVDIGLKPVYVVCSPELTRQVLVEDRTFDKGGPLYDRARELVGNGLGSCPHHQHRGQRRLVQPLFHPDLMPGYARVMTDHITDLVSGWHEGEAVDLLAALQVTVGRVLLSTMFTCATPAVLSALLNDLHTVQATFLPRLALPTALDKLPIPALRRYNRARARLRLTISRLVTDYRARGTDGGDLLSVLLSHGRSPGGGEHSEPLSDQEIAEHCLTFFIAGTETTASILTWALHLVARHAEVERELHDEVDRVLPDRTTATFDDVPDLRATGRVITETLRMYPPVWMVTRTITTGTHLAGHRLPAGGTVVISPYLIHHRRDLYPDPDRFDPGRWDEGGGARRPRGSLIPFGGGARKCIGDTFGTIEATLALATIVRRWRLHHLASTEVRPAPGLILNPRGVVMVPASRATNRRLSQR